MTDLTLDDVRRIVREARDEDRVPDLRAVDLSVVDLRAVDLSVVDPTDMDLLDVDLRGATLNYTHLDAHN